MRFQVFPYRWKDKNIILKKSLDFLDQLWDTWSLGRWVEESSQDDLDLSWCTPLRWTKNRFRNKQNSVHTCDNIGLGIIHDI